MNSAEVNAVMGKALAKLEQLYTDAAIARGWSLNVFGTGDTIDSALAGARNSIDFLGGEYRQRVLDPESLSEGLTGEAAWEGWRDLADSTGQQLARISGAIDKWDLSSTLAQVSLDTGRVIADGVKSAASGLPWVALGLAAVAVLVLMKGGR